MNDIVAVRTAILYYLRGAETALRDLGDSDRKEFARFSWQSVPPIERAEDYKHYTKPYSSVPYRGLICMVMDDLGLRDHARRDAILEELTGVSREAWLESEREYRISQGDSWLIK